MWVVCILFFCIDYYTNYQFHEVDDYNLAKIGRRWFGDRFDYENVKTFSFNIDKPVLNTGATTDADKLSDSIYDELLSRFPNSGDSADQLNTMLGLLYPDGATQKEIIFDRGLQKESKQRIYVLPFGDGYEQRAKNGINTKEET